MRSWQRRTGTSFRSSGKLPWTGWVAVGTLGGGLLGALAAWVLGQGLLASGLLAGSVIALGNFLGLKALTQRTFDPSRPNGGRKFWLGNAVRWVLLGLACWILLRISGLCLLGALLAYLWFLAVLTWVGVKVPPGPEES